MCSKTVGRVADVSLVGCGLFITDAEHVVEIQSSCYELCPSCNRYIKTLNHYVSEASSASIIRQEVQWGMLERT
jgi:isoaspartyl peptidase/L-asparaginase-like protein (Ntn-hydrolase superfamily)